MALNRNLAHTLKELIVLSILKFKYFVIRIGDMSPNHFAKRRK